LSVEYQFGSRPAAASPVTLQPKCDREACWIESVEHGWLFLLPGSKGTGWLLSVGDSVESLLATSRLIKEQLSNVDPPRGIFPSHPRVSLPLSAPGWVACGTAAMGFDPLCGDGTGNAVREAILASAMIRAICTGGDPPSLIAYYQARLLAGFQKHIALCLDFYESGSAGPWWHRQLDDLKHGLEWCSEQLPVEAASRYRLNGFQLEPAELKLQLCRESHRTLQGCRCSSGLFLPHRKLLNVFREYPLTAVKLSIFARGIARAKGVAIS